MITITATELKNDLSKYLYASMTEDVLITKNGKVISKLSNPNSSKVAKAKSLFGILPNTMTLDEARDERMNEK